MLTIELICQHAPHKCRCRHNVQTEVDRNDLTNQLISILNQYIEYNPALLKYLGKRSQNQSQAEQKQAIKQQQKAEGQPQQPYRSIVEQKGLNFCIDDTYNREQSQAPQVKPQKQEKRPEQVIGVRQIEADSLQLNQRKEQKAKAQVKLTSKQKQVKKYHKDLRNKSRYLSDTAFRKYFNRQCFENYGRNNTQDRNDGFVYGNYMKTYNINPHTGQNIPVNEETFYRALVSGSPQKYAILTQEVKLGLTQEATPQGKKATLQNVKSLEKERLNVQKMLHDNQQHSRVKHKYEHLHLKKSLSPKNSQPQRHFQSPSQLGIHTKKHFNQQPARISRADPQLDVVKQPSSGKQSMKPNAQSQYIASQETQKLPEQNNKASYMSVQQLRKQTSINQRLQSRYVISPKSLHCQHNENQQTVDCAACLNRMKKMMLELIQKDPEFAERMINSAKKSVMYKNYALNNFQNAAMNPHNYRREDGRLNIFEG